MLAISGRRPRNVDSPRAAAILYGDWGTSKAYVIGLAFAVAGYSSFWLIGSMCLLTGLVGVNYMTICRHYPDGGGVYASVRHRSETLSIVGAFLLVADYLVTAAISALSAFQYLGQYLGIAHPELWAAGSIVFIGGLNFFGPRHTGGLAFLISVPAVVVVVLLSAFCLPHLGEAWRHVEPLTGGFWKNWNGFVGVVLALSGVEAIANATGVMKLDPGSTVEKPSVRKTSTPAVLAVMIEVCLFTALLGLAMHALGGLHINKDDVDAPGHPGVRDYMLGYLGEVFVGHALGALAGKIAAIAISVVFAFLLLSAVNTAIVDLIAISFLMSRDKELPAEFEKLNKFGVPVAGMILATIVPAILVIAVKDMSGLADLYAVGVVGAIATNLGASSTDRKLDLVIWERVLMLCTFVVMLSIEITLLLVKPNARVFAVTLLAVALILRGLASERTEKKKAALAIANGGGAAVPAAPLPAPNWDAAFRSPLACAVRGIGKTLDFAIDEARETNRPLYLLFIREQPLITEEDRHRKWREDKEASEIFDYAHTRAEGHVVLPCYVVSDSPAESIVDVTATSGASRLILGAPQRGAIVNFLRGNIIRQIASLLPDDVDLIVYA